MHQHIMGVNLEITPVAEISHLGKESGERGMKRKEQGKGERRREQRGGKCASTAWIDLAL